MKERDLRLHGWSVLGLTTIHSHFVLCSTVGGVHASWPRTRQWQPTGTNVFWCLTKFYPTDRLERVKYVRTFEGYLL